MTNSGGGDPSNGRNGAPIGPVGPKSAAGAGAAQGVEGADAAEAAVETGAVDGAEGVERAGSSEAIAQALAAGQIDVDGARAQIIDDALRASLPPDADPAVIERLRAELEAVLAGDPTLERLLTP